MGALSGSAVIVGISAQVALLTTISGIIVALFSAFDLVFDFSEKARQADGLYRQWSLLAQEIAGIEQPTAKQITQLRQTRLKIEMEEGPTLDLLERRCSYDEAMARGVEINQAWVLTPRERRLAQFVLWRPAKR